MRTRAARGRPGPNADPAKAESVNGAKQRFRKLTNGTVTEIPASHMGTAEMRKELARLVAIEAPKSGDDFSEEQISGQLDGADYCKE